MRKSKDRLPEQGKGNPQNGYGYPGYGYPNGGYGYPQDGSDGYSNGYPNGYGYPGYGGGYGGGYGYPGYGGGYGYPGYGGGYGYPGYGGGYGYPGFGYPGFGFGYPQMNYIADSYPQEDYGDPYAESEEEKKDEPKAEETVAPEKSAASASPASAPAQEGQSGGEDASKFEDVDLSKYQGSEELKAEAEEIKRKWYSVTAEFENYRKRTQNTRAEAYKEGRADIVKKLFPIGDNLDRAIKSCQDETTKKGVEMVLGAFNKLLESEEITVIDPLNQPFDPNECEAIMAQDAQPGQASGIVTEVYVKGYRQGDKVLRYAQVIVTK